MIIIRFLTGLGAMACFMTSFVLMVEHVSHRFSMLVGIGESMLHCTAVLQYGDSNSLPAEKY